MKRFKEKVKAVFHIIFDREYIVFTVTVKDNERKSLCALISDNASKILIDTTIRVLNERN